MMGIFTALSITAGYHRHFSHKCYDAHRSVQIFYACFGAAAYQGSILDWSTDHRNHHRYTETDKDPHNINKGFWHAHFLWVFYLAKQKDSHVISKVLLKNSIITSQHKHYVLLSTFVGIVFPTLIAAVWGDPIGGFLIAGLFRIFLGYHGTWSINSVCHTFGKTNYTDQTAKDNWVTAIFICGVGFHNYHHKFPIDYRNRIKWHHFNPSKWFTKGLSWLKITKNIKQAKPSQILRYNLLHQRDKTQSVNNPKKETRCSISQQIKIIKKIECKLDRFKNLPQWHQRHLAWQYLLKKQVKISEKYIREMKANSTRHQWNEEQHHTTLN